MTIKFGGYAGKLLRINLSTEDFQEESLKQSDAELFLGGRGLGAKLLYDEVLPHVNPLSPENKLFFMTGPITGTSVPLSNRLAVVTKSPLTGIYLYTMAGGHFADEIKFSGYDGIIIEGKASKPTYILIRNSEVEFRDATRLWNTSVSKAVALIKEELRLEQLKIACIGPAGERLVKYAAIITDDKRACGRGGAGAVMGSKNLKAIAIFAEDKHEVKVANPELLRELVKEAYVALKKHPGPRATFPKYGTAENIGIINAYGMLPTRNWSSSIFEEYEKIDGPRLWNEFTVKNKSCPRCPIPCTRVNVVKEGSYSGATTEGPEYETIASFGSCCGNSCLESIIMADMLCDDLGLDTISTGTTIAFAMECYERGIISKDDVDGLELTFGNDKAMIEAIKRIAFRQGSIGNLLAEGSREAAKRIGKGSERFAMQVKGLEMGNYDPRGAYGMAIVYAVGNRGGCHHSIGLTVKRELEGGTRYEIIGKGKLVKEEAELRIIMDSSTLCTFGRYAFTMEMIAKFISAVTGMEMTVEELKRMGDRINTLERAYNIREGLSKEDDTLPRRLLEERVPEGPCEGRVITPDILDRLVRDYYVAMGWSYDTGIPLKSVLQELKLDFIINDLY